MIVAAAMRIDGKVRALPAPARHHDIIRLYPLTAGHEHGTQGFIDDQYGFVDRRDAANIAVREGQIDAPKWPPKLYSEDLW